MVEVVARVGPAMERLARAQAAGDVVVVGHGGAIRAAVAHALCITADNACILREICRSPGWSGMRRACGLWGE